MPRVRRRFIFSPNRLKLAPTLADLRRFLAKVELDAETGCWNWQGHCDENGYGQFKIAKQARGAHRVSYALFVRPIPHGREIDHADNCRNPSCVNPAHLIATRPIINATRGGYQRHQYDDSIPF